MKNVAVIISGCGYLDGAEIFETVFTLLELDKHNVNVKIFAPNKNQHHVINHLILIAIMNTVLKNGFLTDK
ncbi:hypothetical protein [Candidatus Tisiphia endosymbiont of Neophilaenus lineatus]|uniref:hypothetical protein n=1 Tax=Candidatus Tisiphia endosymbiont of Neophilaenus lineatus TaxID=3139336 RepID=UPI0035CC0C1F